MGIFSWSRDTGKGALFATRTGRVRGGSSQPETEAVRPSAGSHAVAPLLDPDGAVVLLLDSAVRAFPPNAVAGRFGARSGKGEAVLKCPGGGRACGGGHAEPGV